MKKDAMRVQLLSKSHFFKKEAEGGCHQAHKRPVIEYQDFIEYAQSLRKRFNCACGEQPYFNGGIRAADAPAKLAVPSLLGCLHLIV
jgi:hypothetical protein